MWIRRVARESGARAALGLALALGAAPSPAQPAAATAVDAAPEEMIVTIRANSLQRGEYTVLRLAGGDFWVAARDLQRLGMAPEAPAQRSFQGEPYYSLAALGAQGLLLDESDLSLSFNLPTSSFEGTRIDLGPKRAAASVVSAGRSLILGYRASVRHGQGEEVSTTLETDANLRLDSLLLRQETALRNPAPGGGRFRRGLSQVIWDLPASGSRWVFGDVVTFPQRFGTAVNAAGLQFRRVFDLTPNVIRQPGANFQTQTVLPADVELTVDGARVLRTRVGPGPISVSNLLQYGGTRNVRLTVTDIAGRVEVIEQPFLFTDQVLAHGLHDFSYFVGKRSVPTATGFDYEEAIWQGTHAYGVSDSLTLAAGGEGSSQFRNFGVGASWRSDRLGLLSADLLTSADRTTGLRANGWSARYVWAVPNASVLLGRSHFDPGFRSFLPSPASLADRDDWRIGLAASLANFALGADISRTEDAFQTTLVRSVHASFSPTRASSLTAQVQSTRINDKTDWMAQVFFRLELDGAHWVSTSARTGKLSRDFDLQTGKSISVGEGFGYRAGVTNAWGEGGRRSVGYAHANWNLPHASLEFFGSQSIGGSGPHHVEATATGAIVAVDGYFRLARAVPDSFVLAKLGVPQAGVEVMVNNQVQGRTESDGTILLPRVIPYSQQEVSLNERQLRLEYTLRDRRLPVAVPFRSGAVVDFGAKKARAVTGFVWLLEGGQRLPLGGRTLEMSGPAGSVTIETSTAGDFYLEDAPPGRYATRIETRGKTYSCRLDVPDSDEVVVEVKEGVRCE